MTAHDLRELLGDVPSGSRPPVPGTTPTEVPPRDP